LVRVASEMNKNEYGQYLIGLPKWSGEYA
jgi:hypothetical protein